MSDLFVDNIKHQSSQGSGTITIGASGEKIDLGATAGGTFTARPAFLAYRVTTNQSLSQNTTTNIIMNGEAFDSDSAYDTSTGKFTVPTGKAGKYFFTAGFQINATATEVHSGLQMRDGDGNGVGTPYTKPDPFINYSTSTMGSVMSIVCDMEEGYTINPVFYTNTSGITLTTGRPYFGGYRLIGA